MAVVVHLRSNQVSLSFFTRWPLDYWVRENWPEVYTKAMHWVAQRSTWYCKYDPLPACRDTPPSDNPRHRLKVAGELQRQLWNVILPDAIFAATTKELQDSIIQENTSRSWAYGPGTHGQSIAEGVETYRQVRITGVANTDAPQYDAHQREVRKEKERAKKRSQGNVCEWADWSM